MRVAFSSSARFKRLFHPTHGPQTWAWWRLFSLSIVKLPVHAPSTGYRLWVYTRWGAAFFEWFFDRRTRLQMYGPERTETVVDLPAVRADERRFRVLNVKPYSEIVDWKVQGF